MSCPRLDAHATLWATLNINIETSAVVTLIGDLADLDSFKEQSYATFRNKGDIKASFNFDAAAELRFTTGPTEVVGRSRQSQSTWVSLLIAVYCRHCSPRSELHDSGHRHNRSAVQVGCGAQRTRLPQRASTLCLVSVELEADLILQERPSGI